MTVSALVSCYHAEQFVERRMKNLLAEGVEVVVVCQKNSKEHKIAKKFPVKLITTVDIPTVGKAWNLAIQNSTGEFLTIANTDDLIYKDGFEHMKKVFRNEQVGLVFPRIDLITTNTVTSWDRMRCKSGVIPDMYNLLSVKSIIGPMPMWRRSLHEQFGYLNEEYEVITDYEWCLRLAKGGVGFYYIAEPMGLYLRRADSLEHREGEKLREERLKVRPQL